MDSDRFCRTGYYSRDDDKLVNEIPFVAVPLNHSPPGVVLFFGKVLSMASSAASASYKRLSPRLAIQLAAPHTWAAAVIPAFLGFCFAWATAPAINGLEAAVLLLICVLMQSSVNTFNDYFDFVKGTDTADDNVEVSASVLVYNNVNPRSVLVLAIAFLVCAFLLGIYVIWQSGFIPLILGLIGALAVLLYSGGATPLSYLPLGEVVSGVVMGGLIPLACFTALVGYLDPWVLLLSVPSMIGVALIMMTNNTCDIEKDIEAGRRTLPVLLGRLNSRRCYHGLMVLWVILIIALVAWFHTTGLILMPFLIFAAWARFTLLFENPLAPPARIGAMGAVGNLNLILGAFYGAAFLI